MVDDPADLIASTANNLKKDGWQTGQTWGYEVVVPQGFDYILADRFVAPPGDERFFTEAEAVG